MNDQCIRAEIQAQEVERRLLVNHILFDGGALLAKKQSHQGRASKDGRRGDQAAGEYGKHEEDNQEHRAKRQDQHTRTVVGQWLDRRGLRKHMA